MAAYDHYEEAKAVAGLLSAEGFAAQAEQVLSAMKEGKTGTEIFMILRFRLANLLATAELSERTKERVHMLHSNLDEALNK